VLQEEGDPRLELAPLAKIPPGLPATWVHILSHKEPTKVVWDALWQPMARSLPRTLKTFKRALQGIGLLTTKSRPPSLIYAVTAGGGEDTFAQRGFAAGPVQHPRVKALPAEFLEFYQVHNGWYFPWTRSMGPLPVEDCYTLSDDVGSPSRRFLAVFQNGGGAHLGFDLDESPPVCYTVWPDDDPEVLPDIWRAIDRWIAAQYEGLDPA
jgi:hypothetical protein